MLAPRLIQSMKILQLPILELQERIRRERQENPVLEPKETSNDAPAGEVDNLPDVVPDLVVERTGQGTYEVLLREDWVSSLAISRRHLFPINCLFGGSWS